MTDDMKRVLEKAIEHYGKSHQLAKCIEEVGEFLQAVGKYYSMAKKHNEWKKSSQGPATVEDTMFCEEFIQVERHLQEEIADAIITLQQMRLIYGPEHVDWWTDYKLERLDDKIEKEKRSV